MMTPDDPSSDGAATALPAGISKPATVIEHHCITCGYPLRGLPESSACPECATPFELTMRAPALADAGPEYLRGLRRGVNVILLALIILVGHSILDTAYFLKLGGGLGLSAQTVGSLAWPVSCVVAVMNLYGYWCYAQPDPTRHETEPARSARVILRMSVAGFAVVFVVEILLRFVFRGPATSLPGTGFMVVRYATSIVIGVLLLTRFFSTLVYTRTLAARIPDARLMSRCSRLMWLLPVIYLGPVAATYVVWGLSSPASFAGGMSNVAFSGVRTLGALTAYLLYYVLLSRLRQQLTAILATGTAAGVSEMVGRDS